MTKIKKNVTLLLIFGLAICFFGLAATQVRASNTAAITASPASGSYNAGVQFSVKIAVSGGGQSFTSFGANISTTNLTVVKLTKGPVTKWTTEPSASSLNFFGAVAGQTDSMTVYTLTVKGKAAGTANISVSGGSVKQTDGYTVSEILSSQSGGTYTIKQAAAAVTAPAQPAETTPVAPAPVVPAVTAPVMPDSQSDLEVEWRKLTVEPTLNLQVGVDVSAATDTTYDTLTGVNLSGLSPSTSAMTVYVFSAKITQTATANESGTWSMILTDALKSGEHTAYLVATRNGVSVRSTAPLVFSVNAANKTANEVIAATTEPAAPASSVSANASGTLKNLPWLWVGLFAVLILVIFLITVVVSKRRHNRFVSSGFSRTFENNPSETDVVSSLVESASAPEVLATTFFPKKDEPEDGMPVEDAVSSDQSLEPNVSADSLVVEASPLNNTSADQAGAVDVNVSDQNPSAIPVIPALPNTPIVPPAAENATTGLGQSSVNEDNAKNNISVGPQSSDNSEQKDDPIIRKFL